MAGVRSIRDNRRSPMPNPSTSESDSPPSATRLHVVLVEPEIAGNTGAIGRSCVAVGAMLWLVRPLGFLIDDRRIRRAGLDYWPHLQFRVVDSLDEVAESLGHDRFWLFSTKAANRYVDVSYQAGDALVFGPESRGLSSSCLSNHPERAVRIPIRAEARSLNLSSAAAIGLYEAVRQIEA